MPGRRTTPYREPAPDAPLRLAFTGRRAEFAPCALHEDSPRVRTLFADEREPRRLRARLAAFAPHAVVAFAPNDDEREALAELPAAVVGVRCGDDPLDPAAVDRVVAADAPAPGAWRTLPLPVADTLYRPVRPVRGTPRMLFGGRSTPHRERFLMDVKHRFDCLHVASGVAIDELEGVLDRHHIAFALAGDPPQALASAVFRHLAAGQLVIAEPVHPAHGLEPGWDHIEVAYPEDLLAVATEARAFPVAFHAVRVRGRQKAEHVRASRVWPALIRDLFADLAAFGTERELSGAAAAA
jgi:hypothetical protein